MNLEPRNSAALIGESTSPPYGSVDPPLILFRDWTTFLCYFLKCSAFSSYVIWINRIEVAYYLVRSNRFGIICFLLEFGNQRVRNFWKMKLFTLKSDSIKAKWTAIRGQAHIFLGLVLHTIRSCDGTSLTSNILRRIPNLKLYIFSLLMEIKIMLKCPLHAFST